MLLSVEGMHCASCSMLIERTLSDLPGIVKAQVNSVSEKLSLEFSPSVISLETIAKDISELGYELILPKTEKHTSHTEGHDDSAHTSEHDHSSSAETSPKANDSFPIDTKIALTLAAITAFAMGWDVLGQLGWIMEMGSVPRELFHTAMPIFAVILLSTVGRGYFAAVWRFFRTGNA